MGHKRSYSPTIDEIRQFNIKKFKLLDDLNNLSLSNAKKPEVKILNKDPNVEIIPNIEEFLIQNQSDRDVIESTNEMLLDANKIEIPVDLEYDDEFLKYLNSKDEIFYNYYTKKKFNLVKYFNPFELVYKIWERWYFQVFKLNQLNELMNDEKIPNNYGNYYNNESSDIEMMDEDV